MSVKNSNTQNLVFAGGVVLALWYVVYRFLPPVKTPTKLGGSQATPGDLHFNRAQILHSIMRDCWKNWNVTDFFKDNSDFIQSDEDFEKLYNAFGVKPYDWCLYELNLPDFIYPDLDLFQWIWSYSNKEERKDLNEWFEQKNISYRF